MPERLRKLLASHVGLALGVAGALLAIAVARTAAFQRLELRAQTGMLAARPRQWNPVVVVLANDDATIRRAGWPLRRATYARLVSAMRQAGARALGMDFSFNAKGVDSPEGDAALAEAIGASGQTTLAVPCIGDAPDDPRPLHDLLAPAGLPVGPAPALQCPGVVPPYGALARSGPLCTVELRAGSSDSFSGVSLFSDVVGVRLPTLALRMLSLGTGQPIEQQPQGVRVGDVALAVGADGTAPVSVRVWEPWRSAISAADAIAALEPEGPPRFKPELAARLRDKYVVFANTAGLLKDVGPGPGGEFMPLALFHAALLQDLLERRPVQQAPAPVAPLSAALLAALVVAAALRTRPPVAAASLALLVLGIVGGALIAASHGVRVSAVEPALAASLAFLGALGGRLVSEGRERALLKEAFGAYVDPAVMERILQAPDQYLALGGARRELTVLFSDIQGYTGLSNALPPEDVIALLREYLEVMTHLVRAHRGRVDKIMGDGIMAVFGDPVPDSEHAASAVAVAVEMQREMARLTNRWSAAGKARLAIRIGVATGEVFVGNIGARGAKIEYTVLGPTVNLASRLEGKAPAGGVLVSERTREACGERFAFDRVDGLTLKGYAEGQVAFLARGKPAA